MSSMKTKNERWREFRAQPRTTRKLLWCCSGAFQFIKISSKTSCRNYPKYTWQSAWRGKKKKVSEKSTQSSRLLHSLPLLSVVASGCAWRGHRRVQFRLSSWSSERFSPTLRACCSETCCGREKSTVTWKVFLSHRFASPDFVVVRQILDFRPVNGARRSESSNNERQLLDVGVALGRKRSNC